MDARGKAWVSKKFSQSVSNWTPEMIANRTAAVFGMQIDEIKDVQKEYEGTFGLNAYGGRMKREEENGIYPC